MFVYFENSHTLADAAHHPRKRKGIFLTAYKRLFASFFSLHVIYRYHMCMTSGWTGRSTAGGYHQNSNPHLVWYCRKEFSIIYMMKHLNYHPFSQKCKIFTKKHLDFLLRRQFLQVIIFIRFYYTMLSLCSESLKIIY